MSIFTIVGFPLSTTTFGIRCDVYETYETINVYLPGAAAKVAAALPAAEVGEPVLDIKELEKRHILETLRAVGGVRKIAAERLNMSERTLRHKLQQYREQDGDFQG